MVKSINPGNLEARVLLQFDALVERGNLLWRTTTPQLLISEPFNFQFRSANSLTAKPILSSNDPRRFKNSNAFSDSDPDFFIEHVGPEHSLILNKYCVVRPQYLIHTNIFVPQTDHLTETDLSAALSVLSQLNSPHVVIYNCGFEAGSSLGHKHLQVLPLPPNDEFDFFPNTLGISEVPKVPYQHAVKKLPATPSSSQLIETYKALVNICKVNQAAGHNVLIVNEWMLVIPRTHGRKGILSANAVAMAGMVWITGEEEMKLWVEQGPMKLLCYFGVVKDGKLS